MKKFLIAAAVLAPSLALAQDLGGLRTLLGSIGDLIQLALPIVVGLALLGFFWGLVKFIFSQGNEESKQEAKKVMIWSVVALFVMISVWGLVEFIQSSLGIQEKTNPDTVPTVPGL